MSNNNERSDTGKGFLFKGCLTLIILMIVFAGVLAGVYFYGKQSIGPYVDRYLDAMENKDYERAYNKLISDEWREVQTYEQFTEFESGVKTVLGGIIDKRLNSVNIQKKSGQKTVAQVAYNIKFHSGPADAVFTLVKQKGEWLVAEVRYNSDLMTRTVTCEDCGTVNPVYSVKCSNCGKEILKIDNSKAPSKELPPAGNP